MSLRFAGRLLVPFAALTLSTSASESVADPLTAFNTESRWVVQVARPLTVVEIAAFERMGLHTAPDLWVRASSGQNHDGFYLAALEPGRQDVILSDHRVVSIIDLSGSEPRAGEREPDAARGLEATSRSPCLSDGDVNGDGILSFDDVFCVVRCSQGELSESCLVGTGCEEIAADVDCDGQCTEADVEWIVGQLACGGPPVHCGGTSPPCFAATSAPEPANGIPTISLSPAHPNPFQGETSFWFTLPTATDVEIVVFDVTGRRVTTLIRERLGSGEHGASWTGRWEDGDKVSPGVYFVRFEAGETSSTRRVVRGP